MMVILVRHGEATHHTLNLTGGWTDSDLTTKGKMQIQLLADKLAKDFAQPSNFRILTSDLKRSVESAVIIAKGLNFKDELELCPFLREKNNGIAAGLSESEAKKLYMKPESLKDLMHQNYPGGETRKEFFSRCVNGMLGYADFENENLIIVAHKGTIQNLIFSWLGLDIEDVSEYNFSFDILPASISVLGINKWREHAVFLLNDTSHLHVGLGYGIRDYKYYKKS